MTTLLLTTLLLTTLLLATLPAQSVAVAARQPQQTPSEVSLTRWDSAAELAAGKPRGVTVTGDALTLDAPAPGRARLGATTYETGRWRSPWVDSGFAFDELVASWEATTTKRSWIAVEVRGRATDGRRSSWDTLARWATGDKRVRRTTLSGQKDDLASVAVDTWRAPAGLTRWQLRVTLARKAGTKAAVGVESLGAVTSAATPAGPTSAPGVGRGVVLDVPAYSQMTHRGHFPQWGGGGEAWCSPTSLAMVLGYFGALPPAPSWALAGDPDPWVDATARAVYDHGYDGTGNWSFNAAYAAARMRPLGGSAFVTRLRDLTEAEQLVAAGIPVVVSIAFGKGGLTGAPISSSNGHLLVVVGFTSTGDVVVNDPAAPSNATVRRTYSRAQLERAWLDASGGTAYVVHDAAHPLPSSPSNW